MEPIVPFDFVRLFVGDHPPLFLLEVAFRTLVMYGYTLLAIRVFGKRGTGRMTTFDFIIVVLHGSAVGDPMFYHDVPLLYGFVVITVIVLVERVVNAWTNRSRSAERVIEDTPSLLIRDGVLFEEVLQKEAVSKSEIYMKLREQGIRHTGDVERVYLEPSGSVSVFKRDDEERRGGESTLPGTASS